MSLLSLLSLLSWKGKSRFQILPDLSDELMFVLWGLGPYLFVLEEGK